VAGGRRGARAGRGRWSTLERELREAGRTRIAGVDEVGRGSLAGPVVACAVIMPPEARAIPGVRDSKQLTARERVRLAALIRRRALALSLGAASAREIDRINIFQATVLAMRRALARLPVQPDHVLVDGRPLRALGLPHTAVVHGDATVFSIACASIVAKVTRDRLMCALARRHPGYAWERNVGYATRAHLVGLDARGLAPHHRRSFTTSRQLTFDFGEAELVAREMLAEAAAAAASCDDPASAMVASDAMVDALVLDLFEPSVVHHSSVKSHG
jgi:ribonuclease HII